MHFTVDIMTFVARAIGKNFLALAVIMALVPESFEFGVVDVEVLAVAVLYVVEPLPNIDISVGVNEPSSPIGHVVDPPTFIHRSI